MDEPCWDRRLSELRCLFGHAADRSKAIDLHDAGVEGCLPLRHYAGRSVGPGGGRCELSRMELIGWFVGPACTRNEEVCLVRNRDQRWRGVSWSLEEAAFERRTVSKHSFQQDGAGLLPR